MDTVAILAYFNFSQKKARELALLETLKYLNQQVDIILVCYGLRTESLREINNIQIINIPLASIVWQKERFYNIALTQIKNSHQYIIWLDADLLFYQQGWLAQLKEKLEKSKLVQLFNRVEDVKFENGTWSSTGLIRKSVVESWQNTISPEDYFNQSGISLKIGCNPGFAWGAKVATIKKIGFPDFMIVGGGDKVLLAAAMGYHPAFFKKLTSNPSLHDIGLDWGFEAFRIIKGQVSYLANTICHFVQGDYNNRNYSKRYQLVDDHQFVIHEYLEINQYGAWQWIDEDNPYACAIQSYFHQRED